MGGRGSHSGFDSRQLRLDYILQKKEIKEIRVAAEIQRAILDGSGGQASVGSAAYKRCACCGEYTIPADSLLAVCPNCGWIDDEYQNQHSNSAEGSNQISLVEAKHRYFGQT